MVHSNASNLAKQVRTPHVRLWTSRGFHTGWGPCSASYTESRSWPTLQLTASPEMYVICAMSSSGSRGSRALLRTSSWAAAHPDEASAARPSARRELAPDGPSRQRAEPACTADGLQAAVSHVAHISHGWAPARARARDSPAGHAERGPRARGRREHHVLPLARGTRVRGRARVRQRPSTTPSSATRRTQSSAATRPPPRGRVTRAPRATRRGSRRARRRSR
jgi:hypothetical protein